MIFNFKIKMKLKYNFKNRILTKIITFFSLFLFTWEIVNNNDELVKNNDIY